MNSVLDNEEKIWFEKLSSKEYDQGHLFSSSEASVENIKQIIEQISTFDNTYPGGVLEYIKRARKLLQDARNNVNIFEQYTVDVPQGEKLSVGTPNFIDLENIGTEEIAYCVFVLVAGGLGERLGYPGIKISMPIELTTETKFIQLYALYILAYEKYITENDKWPDTQADKFLPFVIMTSNDTHEKTLNLLNDNAYFGLRSNQVILLKQNKVLALSDNEAHIATKENDNFVLESKPHGHGDVHTLLYSHGLPNRWLKENRRWLFFFQDTNALIFRALPSALAVSKKRNFAMNTIAIPRKPGEAVGALCKLVRKDDGSSITLNVEYNILEPLLKANNGVGDICISQNPEIINNEAQDSVRYSPYPGNSNALIFSLNEYDQIITKTAGVVPEFVNPKYKDSSKTKFKSPTRLECMMQDLARLFDNKYNVGFTEYERWFCFSTVKNNLKEAKEKSAAGLLPECAFSGECDQYANNTKLLQIACKNKAIECEFGKAVDVFFADIVYSLGPRIVLLPSWGFTLQQIQNNLLKSKIQISSRSTLVIDGNVKIDGLDLDGTLILKSECGKELNVQGWCVKNEGWNFVQVEPDENVSPHISIRGYNIIKKEIPQLQNSIKEA